MPWETQGQQNGIQQLLTQLNVRKRGRPSRQDMQLRSWAAQLAAANGHLPPAAIPGFPQGTSPQPSAATLSGFPQGFIPQPPAATIPGFPQGFQLAGAPPYLQTASAMASPFPNGPVPNPSVPNPSGPNPAVPNPSPQASSSSAAATTLRHICTMCRKENTNSVLKCGHFLCDDCFVALLGPRTSFPCPDPLCKRDSMVGDLITLH